MVQIVFVEKFVHVRRGGRVVGVSDVGVVTQ